MQSKTNKLTTMMRQLRRMGEENTSDINIPLLSKYCWPAKYLKQEKHNKQNDIIKARKITLLWKLQATGICKVKGEQIFKCHLGRL